jgi:hypothetical protein
VQAVQQVHLSQSQILGPTGHRNPFRADLGLETHGLGYILANFRIWIHLTISNTQKYTYLKHRKRPDFNSKYSSNNPPTIADGTSAERKRPQHIAQGLQNLHQDSQQALQKQIAQGLSEKKEQAEKLEETTRQEKTLRARVSELETADAELMGEQLGQDAQIWLFARAKAVFFDDYSHFRQF